MKNDLSHLMAYLRAAEYSHEIDPSVKSPKPIITISRQRGANGTLIAQMVAEHLTQKNHDAQPWVVIDRNLTQHVMEDHHLSQKICEFLTEEQEASTRERVEKVLGLQPSKWTAVEKMAQTMMHLAEIGHVIFVGRAAHIVMAELPQAYHVRVIGSVDFRVQHVMEFLKISRADAEAVVRKTDYNRAHFVSSYFHANPADPSRYHLTINTEWVSVEKAVLLISDLVSTPELHPDGAPSYHHLPAPVPA